MSSAVAGVAKGRRRAKKKEKADRREKAPKKKEKTAKKDERQAGSQEKMAKKAQRRAEKNLAKARTRDSLQALSKLGERVNGSYQIISQPPLGHPGPGPGRHLRHVPRRGDADTPAAVPRLPGHAAR